MCVTISLRGNNLDPDYVTSYLNLMPSFSFRKGDKFNRSKGEFVEGGRDNGVWVYHSTDSVDSDNISEHISHVMEVLRNSKSNICDDKKVKIARLDIFLSLEVAAGKSNMGNIRLIDEYLILLQRHGLEMVVSYDAYSEP